MYAGMTTSHVAPLAHIQYTTALLTYSTMDMETEFANPLDTYTN